jgi:hypothetical protein
MRATRTSVLVWMVAAACGHGGAPAAVDASSADASDRDDANAAIDALAIDVGPDACASCWQLPATDVGPISIVGTCTYADKGWTFNDATGCHPYDYEGMQSPSRSLTIAAEPGGYAITTTLMVDPETNQPYDPYTVELGAAMPTATEQTNPCNPIYGTCVEHDWTMTADSLVLATHSLHDNYSGSTSATTQCWEYTYVKQDCTFTIAW